jgi:hypothetical protein
MIENDAIPVGIESLLTQQQFRKISCRPEHLHMFAHKIALAFQTKFQQ